MSTALGPSVGALGKIAKGGRNWEAFSNDPYLPGQLAYETVVVSQVLLRTFELHIRVLLTQGTGAREACHVLRQASPRQ